MSGPDGVVGYGALERSADASVLRYHRRLAHTCEKVWSALTEDAHLAAWFPTTIGGAAPRRSPAALHVSRVRGGAL